MKPVLGWTLMSRDQMRQVERSLTNGAQDTRDEIGFLILHQGFADRFFPGTSVLHTRVRYALFVPWLYCQAAADRRRGRDLEGKLRDLLITLAERLNLREKYGVIGGDKPGQLTSQPPDRVYWTALRTWGLLLSGVESRAEALRRLSGGAVGRGQRDDDGGDLDDGSESEVFAGLPKKPKGWFEPESPLDFLLPADEREYLKGKLSILPRPGEAQLSLLARLTDGGIAFAGESHPWDKEVRSVADPADREALSLAQDAAHLAAIGRTVYGALVEDLREQDAVSTAKTYRNLMPAKFEEHGARAAHCDIVAIARLIPGIPGYVLEVLRQTCEFVRNAKPQAYLDLLNCYKISEVRRKGSQRARLEQTPRSRQRRFEWDPDRHNVDPLHYRWRVVESIRADLNGRA
ncbi:MAG: DUF6361 family protein [Verrucomicrobiota bacterium]